MLTAVVKRIEVLCRLISSLSQHRTTPIRRQVMDDACRQVVIDAVELYRKRYNADPEVGAFAPGRVNLIGEVSLISILYIYNKIFFHTN
jgi:hypothetical protein